METKVGQKLFGKSCVTGKLFVMLRSVAYQKYPNESNTSGISYGKKIYLKTSPLMIKTQK